MNTKTSFGLIVALLVIVGLSVVGFRLLADGEDTWICDNNQWVKHGNPSAPMPTTGCGEQKPAETAPTPTPTPAAQEQSFKADDFEITAPGWPALDAATLGETGEVKIAVKNDQCGVIVTARTLPQGQTLETYVQGLLDEQLQKLPVKLVSKEFTDKTTHIESEITLMGQTINSSQRGYLTSKGTIYSVVFAGEKSALDGPCRADIDKVLGSVVVK
ncbi:MAG: hypothetical protein PHI23_01335 [Candidatus Peribacteraceae bacterium]|nr:hypothetical protein [Candidatus Peribacteraceae bacterium]